MSSEVDQNKHRWPWARFSLRSLFVVTLVVAAYLGGRISQRQSTPDLAGTWTAKLPAGFNQPTTLTSIGNDRWMLRSRANNFNGVYRFRDNRLTILQPEDKRMIGLAWNWNGQAFVLVAEPPARPTGQSYLGTKLVPETP